MTQADDEKDFITINPAVAYRKFNVAVMKYDKHDNGYYVFRISDALNETAARALAQSWSAATRLEVR